MDLITLQLSATNDHLFRNGSRWVLMDTGCAEDVAGFRAELDRNRAEALVPVGR